jgi:hypothetical protein
MEERLRLTVLTSLRACGLALLPGQHTTHFVGDPPVIYSGRTGNPETLCWK